MMNLRINVLLALGLAALGRAANFTVNSPASLIECEPTALSWSGGTEPYYLLILPGGDTSATYLEALPTQTGTSYTWTVDIASGTSVTIEVTDSTGAIAYSSAVTIQAGTETTCVNSTSTTTTSSSSSSSSGFTSTSSVKAATTTTSKSPSSSGTTTAVGTSSTTSAGLSSTTSSTSGATSLSVGASVGAIALLASLLV